MGQEKTRVQTSGSGRHPEVFFAPLLNASQGLLSRDPYRVLVDVLVDLPVRFQNNVPEVPTFTRRRQLDFHPLRSHFPGSTRESQKTVLEGRFDCPDVSHQMPPVPDVVLVDVLVEFSPCVGG